MALRAISRVPVSSIVAASSGRANSIIRSKIVSGNADFVSLPAGLTFRLLASAADPFHADVAGVLLRLEANVDLALTDDAHNFVYLNQDGTLGRSALPCTYSFTAPGAPATDQHWFDLGQNQMKEWSGAAWVAVDRIFIGYARADAAAINARYACEPIGGTPLWRWENFGDGSDGFLDVSAGTTTIDAAKSYTAVVVRGAGIVTSTQNSPATSPLTIFSQSVIACIGTGGIDLTGKGRVGVSGGTGNGGVGFGAGFGGAGGGGGGGTNAGGTGGATSVTYVVATSASGGTAGSGGGGVGGSPAAVRYPAAGLRGPTLFGHGNSGGAGGGSGAANGGNSGAGGGTLDARAPAIAIGASAVIRCSGEDGAAGGGADRGGGGGGGGGILQAWCRNFFNSGTFASGGGVGGGSGGAGSGAGGNGGAGVAARIPV